MNLNCSNKTFFGLILSGLLLFGAFGRYMQYRDEHKLLVCVSPPFPVGNCETIVAVPGERISLNEIAKVPTTSPVVHNYWVRINGRNVPVEVLDDGHNGVDLYAVVPDPEQYHGRSALSPARQLFQDCINAGGHLYGIDEDGDGFMPLLGNSTGDINAYPCVVSGDLSPPYVMPATADVIGTDRDDTNASIH